MRGFDVVALARGLRLAIAAEGPRAARRRPGLLVADRRSALTHLVDTFFDGSTEKVVATLLGPDGGRLTDEELSRIADLVARARDEGVK